MFISPFLTFFINIFLVTNFPTKCFYKKIFCEIFLSILFYFLFYLANLSTRAGSLATLAGSGASIASLSHQDQNINSPTVYSQLSLWFAIIQSYQEVENIHDNNLASSVTTLCLIITTKLSLFKLNILHLVVTHSNTV